MSDRLTAEAIQQARAVAFAQAEMDKDTDTLLKRLGQLEAHGNDLPMQLRRFFIVLHVFDADRVPCALPASQLARLEVAAQDLLKVMGVKPRSSRFSYLHAEALLARARGKMARGEAWSALATLQSARTVATRGTPPSLLAQLAVTSAATLLRLGHARLAETGLMLPLMTHLPLVERPTYFEATLRVLRWAGRDDDFTDQLRDWRAVEPPESQLAAVLAWEELAQRAMRSGDTTELAHATSRQGALKEPRHALLAALWGAAQRGAQAPAGFVHAEGLRRRFGLSLREQDEMARLLFVVKTLEDCYDAQSPLEHRLAALDEMVPRLAHVTDPEAVLLATAAGARWLKSVQQPLRAAALTEDYQRLCRALSQGRRDDLLQVGDALRGDAWERFADVPDENDEGAPASKGAPTGAARRALALSRIGLGALPHLLKSRFSTLFMDKEQARAMRRVQDDQVVQYLVQKIGSLKGPIVKLAQMTSVIHAALPEEVYQAIVQLREDAPGMSAAVARTVVEDELGAGAVKLRFEEWDDDKLAAASIGQLHAARTPDGMDVVVKVQYPGLEDMIRSDIQLLRLLVVPIYRVLFPAVDLKAIAVAVESMVIRECDFAAEAAAQERTRLRLKDVAGIVVPRVVPELSGKRVLTMERLTGKRFSDFARTASAAEKNRVGALVWDVLIRSYFAGEEFSADPHPGNYLFLDDGRVALLDFGAVGQMSKERLELVKAMALATAEGDLDRFAKAQTALGYVSDAATFDFASDMANARQIMRPLLAGGSFKFSYEYFSEVFAYYGLASTNRKQVRFDAGDVPMWRFLIGLQVLMCELEAEADWGQIFWTAAGERPRT